jgi:hypothetical protein
VLPALWVLPVQKLLGVAKAVLDGPALGVPAHHVLRFGGRIGGAEEVIPLLALRVAGPERGELLTTVEEFLGFLGEEARSA